MNCSLRALVATAGLVVLSVAGPANAGASGSAGVYRYTGPAGLVVGPSVSAQIDGNPTGQGVLGVQIVAKAGKLRIQVEDDSGLEVAVRVTAFVDGGAGFQYVECHGADFTTPMRSGSGKVYVTPLAGVCDAGSPSPVVSAPTTGQITIGVV